MIFLKRRAMMSRASFNYKTVSGIGSITLENCVETRFKRFELLGSSAQGENPSIESPKEIKNSGKYDEVSGKYAIDVSVTGKNLFDKTKIQKGYYQDVQGNLIKYDEAFCVSDYIKISDSQSNLCITGLSNATASFVVIFDKDKNRMYSENNYDILSNKGIIEMRKGAKYVRFASRNIENVQVEYGNQSTPYEPYHEPQTIQLELNEPLRGIGEYKDVVTKDGIKRKIGHLERKGGLIWNDWGNQFRIIVHVEKGAILYSKYLCNYTNEVKNFGNQHYIYLYFTKEQIEAIGINTNDTLEVANKKLNEIVANKPIVIEYPLKAPIFEPFPQETQLALDSLHANDGTTVITVDSGEVETGIEVEYAIKN